jgi:GT2 family glycosyltransferase
MKNEYSIDVSIIIVSWNTKKMLQDCIQSIYNETRKYSFEIIVTDNDSPDKSADMVAELFPEVVLIANKDNRGFAAGNNQAMEIAKGKYILLLNPDTLVIDGAIDKMMDYAINYRGAKPLGILTCKLLNGDYTLQKSVNNYYSFWSSLIENRFFAPIIDRLKINSQKLKSAWNHDSDIEIDWAFGAVMLFSREVMDKVGLLDDRFYIYAEEMDYFMRVKKAGYESRFASGISIIHYGKSSSRQRRSAMFIQNYKSFYLFLKKHYGSFSYAIYRLRATLYLFMWYLRYSIGQSEESKEQRTVYWETLKWHFSNASRITLN